MRYNAETCTCKKPVDNGGGVCVKCNGMIPGWLSGEDSA